MLTATSSPTTCLRFWQHPRLFKVVTSRGRGVGGGPRHVLSRHVLSRAFRGAPSKPARRAGGPIQCGAQREKDWLQGPSSVRLEHPLMARHPLLTRLSRALNRIYSGVLHGPARFLPTFLLPISALLAAVGAAHGAAIWLALTGFVSSVSTQLTFLQRVEPLLRLKLWPLLVPIALSLSGGIFTFILMPVLDVVLGEEWDDDKMQAAAAGPRQAAVATTAGSGGCDGSVSMYRGVLYGFAVFHFALLGSACYLVSHAAGGLSPWAFLGLVLSMGCEGGLVFTAAHELLHSPRPMDRRLADALLATMCYMHWAQSHLAHHQKVATWEDPSTARLGESLYSFLPRTIAGNVADGVDMEKARLRQYGLPTMSLSNRMLAWVLYPVGISVAAYLLFGGPGLALFLGQAAAGIVMLEIVNYIEHYGLTREKLSNGRYERVSADAHSWNANSLFTNSVVFRLQRHSDHHEHPNKPFHMLEDCPSAPQLPWSYPTMALLALAPPLYFRIMDRPLAEWRKRRDARQNQKPCKESPAARAQG